MDVPCCVRRSTIALLTTTVIACGVGEQVVARVADLEVKVEALQAFVKAATGMDWQVVNERVASRLFDQFLDQEVVAAAAAGRRGAGIPVDPDARSAAVRALLAEVCGHVPPLPPAALDREIERRLDQVQPARSHVRQMLLDSLEEAAIVQTRLEAGESFVEVSREASRAPNADAGGELGFVVQGTLPQDLDEVIFGLKEGEISPPVQSPAGYHIFQVLEVVPEGPASRSEVEMVARREMGESFARDFIRECVDRLADEVGVILYPDHLWFRYHGRYGGNDEA
jgi:parvulin-like peptidyl-prolyl isomerase